MASWITRPDPFRWFHFITLCFALHSVRIKTDTDRQEGRQSGQAVAWKTKTSTHSVRGGARTPLRTLALSTPKQNYVHTSVCMYVCMCLCHVSISREKSARRAAAHAHFASSFSARLIMQLFFLYAMHTCACMCVYDIISGQALLWCHNI